MFSDLDFGGGQIYSEFDELLPVEASLMGWKRCQVTERCAVE